MMMMMMMIVIVFLLLIIIKERERKREGIIIIIVCKLSRGIINEEISSSVRISGSLSSPSQAEGNPHQVSTDSEAESSWARKPAALSDVYDRREIYIRNERENGFKKRYSP